MTHKEIHELAFHLRDLALRLDEEAHASTTPKAVTFGPDLRFRAREMCTALAHLSVVTRP